MQIRSILDPSKMAHDTIFAGIFSVLRSTRSTKDEKPGRERASALVRGPSAIRITRMGLVTEADHNRGP